MAVESSIPLAEVITRHHQPPEPRRGSRSDRPWWVCPFHLDRNPSLSIIPGTDKWKCLGCGVSGDAIEFVRRMNPAMTFQEAKVAVGALDCPQGDRPARARERTHARPRPEPPPRPEGWQDFIREVVETAEAALWTDMGIKARAYLKQRGLEDGTIKAARLGYWGSDDHREGVYPDRPVWIPRGIVIPWFNGETIEAVQIRRPVKSEPKGQRDSARPKKIKKYIMIRGSRRGIYPGREVIRPGMPLILAEGEFEVLLLNQEIADLAPAITLGSAGDRPDSPILLAMSRAAPWYLAGDTDDAGESSTAEWLARSGRCRRIAPPAGDWTEARQAGIDLRAWWQATLGTNSEYSENSENHPPGPECGPDPGDLLGAPGNLLRADSLPGPTDLTLRWGPGLDDDTPSIDVPRDWRWDVANWPHARWVAWHRRLGELQPPDATVEEIREAERQAFTEIATERTRPDA